MNVGLRKLMLPFLFVGLVTACDSDDDVAYSKLNLKVSLPEAMADAASSDGLSIVLTNATTGSTTSGVTLPDGTCSLTIEEGVYNVTVSGDKIYTSTVGAMSFQQTVALSGILENQSITGAEYQIDINLFISMKGSGWVFKELYFTGSQTPAGSTYYKDKYFEIYNNTDSILYADGISIAEADHLSSSETNSWTDIINDYFVASTIYTIPGAGSDYPVQPGSSIVLADVAINHTTANANSVDLSAADFEWYDDNKLDVDVPEVTNLIKNFSYSLSIWTPHNRGFNAYVIFKPQGSMTDFMANNSIDKVSASGKTVTRYKVANSSILDAVELGTPSDFKSKALSPSLDISYTHCGDGDVSRYGKCVRRKTQSIVNNRVVYMDTNNSAVDFDSTVDLKPHIYQ